MTVWDELWKNKPTSHGIYFNQVDWEKKVKVEGDRLQVKLEAIKTFCEEYYLCIEGDYSSPKAVIDRVWKILEGEG
jgi:hypothetical protein